MRKKRLLSALLTMVLLVNMLCNSAFVAWAGEEIPIMDAEAIGYEIRQTAAEDKFSAEVELVLTERGGNRIQEVILPDGTCVKAETKDGVMGFRQVTENGEKNIIRFTVRENGPIAVTVKYLEGEKEEEAELELQGDPKENGVTSGLLNQLKPPALRPQLPTAGEPETDETKAPMAESTVSVEKPTQAPVEEKPTAPAAEPTQAPAEEKPTAPEAEPTQAPVEEKSTAPAAEPTQAPVAEEPNAPEAESTQAPVAEESAAPAAEPVQAAEAPAEESQEVGPGIAKAVIKTVRNAFFMESYAAESGLTAATASNSTATEDEWKTMEITYVVTGLVPMMMRAPKSGSSYFKMKEPAAGINEGYDIDADGNWLDFSIGKFKTEYFLVDMSLSLTPGVTGRQVVIKMPIGFSISNWDQWDRDVLDAFESRSYYATADEWVYTLVVKDSFTSTAINQTVEIGQNPGFLRSRLKDPQYRFTMDVTQDGVVENMGFTIDVNNSDPQLEIGFLNRDDIMTPGIFTNAVDELSGKPDFLMGIQKVRDSVSSNAYDPSRLLMFRISKEPGAHIPDQCTITIPLPSQLNGMEKDIWPQSTDIFAYLKNPDDSTEIINCGAVFWNRTISDGVLTLNFGEFANGNFGQGPVSGKTLTQLWTETDEIYINIRPVLYVNRVDFEKIATDAQPITYTAKSDVAVEYRKFDGLGTDNREFAGYTNPAEKSLVFRVDNGDDKSLGFAKNASEGNLSQGLVMGGVSGYNNEEIAKCNVETGDATKYAIHTNFAAEWQWTEAFSPVSFQFPITGQLDRSASIFEVRWSNREHNNILYTLEITDITDPNNPVVRTETVTDHVEIYTPVLGAKEYVSGLKVESSLLNYLAWRQYLQALFSAKYKAATQFKDGTTIPDGYLAPVTQTIHSDQDAGVTNTYHVKLLQQSDSIWIWARDGSAAKSVVNAHPGVYTIGEYHVEKKNTSMFYPADGDDYPVIIASGDGIELTDLVSSSYQKLVGFENENGTYIPLAADSPYNAGKGTMIVDAEHYNGLVVTEYNTSRVPAVYDLRGIFQDTGSKYAKKLVFEIRNFGDWEVRGDRSDFVSYLFATKITPGYLGYDEVVGSGGAADIASDPAYEFSVDLNCNYSGHQASVNHYNDWELTGKTSSFVMGYASDGIQVDHNNHFLTAVPTKAAEPGQVLKTNVIFSESFLYDGIVLETIAYDKMNYEMNYKNSYIDFAGTDPDAIALATGLSITTRGQYEEAYWNNLTIEYATNLNGTSQTVTRSSLHPLRYPNGPYTPNNWYIDLSDLLGAGEYFTEIRILLPDDAAYQWSNMNHDGGVFNNGFSLPPIGLARAGTVIPSVYPASGQQVGTKDGVNDSFDQLPVQVTAHLEDLFGNPTEFTATGLTSKIAAQAMLVDRLATEITLDRGVTTAIAQGNVLNVFAKQGYRFSPKTKDLNPNQEIKPVFYYKVDPGFYWDGNAEFWGVDCSGDTRFIPAGTGAGTTGSTAYGILKIDLSDGKYNSVPRASLYHPWEDEIGLIGFDGTKYAQIEFGLVVSYTSGEGELIPVQASWMDVAYDRDENRNNAITNTREYGIDLTDTVDDAPYGPQYLNDKASLYPGKTTTPTSGVGTMLKNTINTKKTVTKGGFVGFAGNATTNYPSNKGPVVTSRDYQEARQAAAGQSLFGAEIMVLGAEGGVTTDWSGYFVVPKSGQQIIWKQDGANQNRTSEYGMKLVGMDFTKLAADLGAGSYTVSYTTDPIASLNESSWDNHTLKNLNYTGYTGSAIPAGVTAVRLQIPSLNAGVRSALQFQFQLEGQKTVTGLQKAYFTSYSNFKMGGAWNTNTGTTMVPVTYQLEDFYLEGTVWDDSSDRDSLYGTAETGVTNVEMKLWGQTTRAALPTDTVQTDGDGKYRLLMPYDGDWEVEVVLPAGKQFAKQFAAGGSPANTTADRESWFDRGTGRAVIHFTGNAVNGTDTQRGVLAGIADENVINLTPGDAELHVGSTLVNQGESSPYDLPVTFEEAADTGIASVAGAAGSGEGTITGHKTGVTTGTVSGTDGYDQAITKEYEIIVYANVSYDGNGNDGGALPLDAGKYYPDGAGSDTVVPRGAGTLYKSGYTFVGWSEDPSAATPQYTPGTPFSTGARTKDILLYAVWTENHYTVNYNPNHPDYNGTIPPKGAEWNDTNLTVDLPAGPTSDGYEFVGWETPAGAIAQPTDKYSDWTTDDTQGTEVTLTGKWKELKDYQVTYDVQGGTMPPGSPDLITGMFYRDTVPTPTPSRPGYVFEGWRYQGTAVPAGSSYRNVEGDSSVKEINLEAAWREAHYYVKYNSGNPDVVISDKTGVKWNDTGLTAEVPDIPTEDGYGFAGWEINGHLVTPEDAYSSLTTDMTDGSFITLTGKWKELTDYRVIYKPGMGSMPAGSPGILEGLRYGDLVPLPTPTPATGGFYFVGWSYNGAWVMPGTSYRAIAGSSQTKEIELVAMWKEVTVSGGGSGGSSGKGPSAVLNPLPEQAPPLSPAVPEVPEITEPPEDLGFLPKTGEESHRAWLGGLMGLLAVVIAAVELDRRKGKKK